MNNVSSKLKVKNYSQTSSFEKKPNGPFCTCNMNFLVAHFKKCLAFVWSVNLTVDEKLKKCQRDRWPKLGRNINKETLFTSLRYKSEFPYKAIFDLKNVIFCF